MTPITGSCMCNKVTYTLKNGIEEIVHCHCQNCRKAHSAAFSSKASWYQLNSDIPGYSEFE